MKDFIIYLGIATVGFIGGINISQPAYPVSVSVEGLGPRDLFAIVYMVKTNADPTTSIDFAYSYADAVMARRKK